MHPVSAIAPPFQWIPRDRRAGGEGNLSIWNEVVGCTHSISSTAFRAASGKSLNFVFLLIPPLAAAAAVAVAVGPADVEAVGAKELGKGEHRRGEGADEDIKSSKTTRRRVSTTKPLKLEDPRSAVVSSSSRLRGPRRSLTLSPPPTRLLPQTTQSRSSSIRKVLLPAAAAAAAAAAAEAGIQTGLLRVLVPSLTVQQQ